MHYKYVLQWEPTKEWATDEIAERWHPDKKKRFTHSTQQNALEAAEDRPEVKIFKVQDNPLPAIIKFLNKTMKKYKKSPNKYRNSEDRIEDLTKAILALEHAIYAGRKPL